MNEIVFNGILIKNIFSGDNGYTIASMENLDKEQEITVVGYFNILPNQIYEIKGEFGTHPKYGEQVTLLSYNLSLPTEENGIIDFLSSSLFKNVGKRTSKKIYDYFEKDTIDILKNEPQKVIELGIRQGIVDEISQKLNVLDGMDILYKTLKPIGVTEYYINEIYQYVQKNKINLIEKFIKNNSYEMIDHIDGFTFAKADSIFLAYNKDYENKDYENKERISSAILDEIKTICYRIGDTYTQKNLIYNNLFEKIGFKLNYEDYEDYISILISKKKIILLDNENNFLTLYDFYNAESIIASNIKNRLMYMKLGFEKDLIISKISNIESEIGINYSNLQKKAITNSLRNNISIITGGPGTGKTTIINAIVKIFKQIKYENQDIKDYSSKIMLCAPTGRAAQRMKEATNVEAKTIHSLLEWDPYTNAFNRDLTNPLIQKLIIIDEFSMVDIFLASSIFQAILPEAIVVIVGDSAQLESVNPGNVLYDLISINKIPLVHLDIIFRQGEGSTIAQMAKNIDNNKELELVNTQDMSIIIKKNNLPQIINEIVQKSYVAGYNEMDVQVLYPKYRGKFGIDSINKEMLPNKEKVFYNFNDINFYLDDKVMQLKNNYDKEIYNGDIGTITKIYNNKNEESFVLEVTFKQKKVNFTKKDLYDLTHAYAISIHKSQGSEFKVVILPISSESENMLNKKLLYTAITRAKEKLVIVGEINKFEQKIYQDTNKRRKTNLEFIFNNN